MPYGYHRRHRGGHMGRHHWDRAFRHCPPPYFFEGPYGPPPMVGAGPVGPPSPCEGRQESSRGPSPGPAEARGGSDRHGFLHHGFPPYGFPHHGPPHHGFPYGFPSCPPGWQNHHHWGKHRGPFGQCSTQPQGIPVLTYFDMAGLAEPIRLVFTAGHIPFEDRRITHEEWQTRYKNYTPLKQVPILEVDGQTIVQSHAILQYAATRAGLWPQDEHQQLTAASIVSRIDEAKRMFVPAYTIEDKEERTEKMAEIAQEVFPVAFGELEAFVSGLGHRFTLGHHITYIDIVLAQGVEELKRRDLSVESYPKLCEINRAVFDLPPIRRYMNDRKPPAKPIIYDYYKEGVSLVAKWCLSVGDISYDEVFMSHEQVQEEKEKDVNFTIPCLEVDGKKYYGQMGLLAYAASRADLCPDDNLDCANAWAICRSLESAFFLIYDHLVSGDTEKLKQTLTERVVPYMKNVDPLVGENQDAEGHVVSNSLSFADFYVAMVYKHFRGSIGVHLDGLELPSMCRTFRMIMNIDAMKKFEYEISGIKPVLNYVENCKKAEAVKWILNYSKIDHENTCVSTSDWEEVHSNIAPTKKSPYMVVDGKLIGGTKGCLTYVAERAGLLPSTYLGRAQAEMIMSAWGKVAIEVGGRLAQIQPDSPVYEVAAKEVRENAIVSVLNMFEKLIAASQHPSGYLVNNQLTYVDVYVASEFQALISGRLAPENYRDTYPNITKVWTLIHSITK